MSRSLGALAVAALVASVMLAPAATLAFNPQPDPPGGKGVSKQSKSLPGLPMRGPGTKGGWKGFHEVDKAKPSKTK